MSDEHSTCENEIRFYYQQGMAPRITTGDAGKFLQEMHHLEVEKSSLKEENERLKTQVEELVEALESLLEIQDEDCRYDHQGYCQSHNLDHIDDGCRVARAKTALAELEKRS